MHSVTTIPGKDLRTYLLKINDELGYHIDPQGTNIVDIAIINNDGDSIRTFLLAKCINKSEPVEVKVDFPFKVFNAISRQVTIQDNPNQLH